jgi:hypothetical protein
MVRYDKCHIGAYDNGQYNHFRLTTGGQGQDRSIGGASPRISTPSTTMKVRQIRIAQSPIAATTSRRNSRAVIPTYFTPTLSAMKYCAAQIASAGGRVVKYPKRDAIDAPKIPIAFAPRHPTMGHRISQMICVGSNELTDGPGGANKFAC